MQRLLLSWLVLGLTAAIPARSLAQDDTPSDLPEVEATPYGVEADAEPVVAPGEDEAEEESHNFFHGGVRLVREHAIAFGVHHAYLRADAPSEGQPRKVFNFVGPSAAYTFYRGHRFGFLMNLEWFFPIHAWQLDGQYCASGCSTRQMYGQTIGYDATFMFAYHQDLLDDLSLNAGIGLHANIIELSDSELRDFNNISMGIGSLATLRYYLTEKFNIGANLSFSVDWADMIHETGVLNFTINWALAATIGVHL